MRFLLACLLLFSASLVLDACRLQPNQLVGDVNAVDIAAKFDGAAYLTTTTFDINGPGFTAQFDVSSEATDSGCVFSAGTVGTNTYIEARLITLPTSPNMHALALTFGKEKTQTFGVIAKKTWVKVAITVSNKKVGGTNGFYEVLVYVNGQNVPVNAKLSVSAVPTGTRTMMIGKCSSDNLGFTGMVDNLRLFSKVKTLQEIQDSNVQFFPMPETEGLVVYYDFNDITSASTKTVGRIGASAPAEIPAALNNGVVAMIRQGTAGEKVTDICVKQGLAISTPNGMAQPPFFGKGGYAQTILCDAKANTSFIVNQRFKATGAIDSISIRTGVLHYWRITAGGLKVEHRTWGGWSLLPRGADFLVTDKTTIRFTDDSVTIQAGPYGFIKITEDDKQNLNYQIGVNNKICVQPPNDYVGYCDFHQTQLSTFEFSSFPVPEMPMGVLAQGKGVLGQATILACPPPSQVYRPDLLPPPPPVPLDPVPTKPGPDPCISIPAARLALFTSACNLNFGDGSARQRCVADSCITNNPYEPPKITCEAQKLIKLTDPLFQIDPSCDSVCPKGCNSRGSCVNGVCVCPPGWVGPDCGSPASFNCWNATSTAGSVVLRPLFIRSSGTIVPAATFQSNLAAYTAAYRVVDSTVVFVARTLRSSTDDTPTYHLVFVNNNGNGNADGGQMTATITGTGVGAASLYSAVVGGPAVTSSVAGNTYTVSSSWRFSGYSVFAISGLPTMADVTVTVTTAGGVDQVLIGSAHLRESDANLASYKLSVGTPIRISGGTCNDTCANINSCSACAAMAQCGWCVDSGKCVPGDRSGPWTYGICQNWRYTFDAKQSRRLTQQLAFPVNPGFTDVFVTTADSLDLPIEIIVSPRDPTKATWDVVYLAQYNRNIRPMFTTYIESILNTLTGYPNLGVGFVSVLSGGFDLIRDLSNPRDTFYIPQAVRGQPTSGVGPISVLATLNNLPIAWRAGSSRLALIVADQPYIPNEVAPATVRATLTSKGIIPVFLVSDNVAASYKSLVQNDLQYGIVMTGIPFNSAQNSIPQATVRALQRAAGYASTYYTDAGIINTATWNTYKDSWQMYGLQPSIFARFLIPTKGLTNANAIATTVLQMPGYGSAKVENVLSDRPVAFATVTKYEVKEGKSVIITLNGRSLRDLFKTLPRVVSLPTQGTLNLVQNVLANGKPTGEFVAGDPITVGATSNDLLNRIYYTANPGTGGQTDFFELSVTDTCADSDKVRIDINIAKDNRPPITEMLPVTLDEDTAAVITLEAADPNGDVLQLYVTQIIHELDQEGKTVFGRAGNLYQYAPAILAGRPSSTDTNAQALLIKAGDLVTDSKGRVIYWPPQNANSYADDKLVPQLKIHPCLEYKAKELSTVEKFESSPTRVTIDVFSVNDAPYVWEDEDPSYPATSPGYGWNTPTGVCWKNGPDCEWDEDFGQEFPWNTPYKYLYVGGDDIEKTDIDIIIKTIECDPFANLTLDLTGDKGLKVGDVIQQRKPGVLAPGINFRPGPDRNNQNGGFGDYYCKISYTTRDVEGFESTNNRVITISIRPVDDKPRIRQQTTLITSVEKIPKEFLIDGFDPEGDSFDVVVVGCSTRKRGQFEVCMDRDCTLANRQIFTCDDVKDAGAAGIKLNKRQLKRGLVPSKQGYLAIFTSDSLGRPTDGLNYQRLTVAFPSPKDAGATPSTFDINFNVIALNNAPVITVNNNTNDQLTLTLVNGEKFLPALEISDEDIANGNIDVKISFTPDDGSSITFIDRSTNNVVKAADIKSTTSGSVYLSGKLLSINAILSGFVFAPKKNDATYTFTITANDNGNSGQCPMGKDGRPIPFDRLLYDASSTCALTAKTQIAVSYVDPTQLKTVALAGSGAAVLILGIIGAALAVRAFNKHAESASYKPWDVFHESDAVLSNPLYEEAGLGGASGIYEAKSGTNKDLLGSSSSESPSYVGLDKPEGGL